MLLCSWPHIHPAKYWLCPPRPPPITCERSSEALTDGYKQRANYDYCFFFCRWIDILGLFVVTQWKMENVYLILNVVYCLQNILEFSYLKNIISSTFHCFGGPMGKLHTSNIMATRFIWNIYCNKYFKCQIFFIKNRIEIQEISTNFLSQHLEVLSLTPLWHHKVVISSVF